MTKRTQQYMFFKRRLSSRAINSLWEPYRKIYKDNLPIAEAKAEMLYQTVLKTK